jgi:uncharacterized protein
VCHRGHEVEFQSGLNVPHVLGVLIGPPDLGFWDVTSGCFPVTFGLCCEQMRITRFLTLPWLFLLVALLVGAAIYLVWAGSSATLSPPRQVVSPDLRAMQEHPERLGLRVRRLTMAVAGLKATPVLLCEPLSPEMIPGFATDPKVAERGRKVRAELEARAPGLLQPWGQVIGTAVALHGHKARKDSFIGVAERLCAAGFRCILPDLPGHGEHPEPITTFGLKERLLPGALVDAVAADLNFDPGPQFLLGYSLGGAVAIQAAGMDPQRWTGVTTIATFCELEEPITRSAIWQFGMLTRPLLAVFWPVIDWRAGFDLRNINCGAAIALAHGTKGHYLIIHGLNDDFVPSAHAERLYAAIPTAQKKLWLVPGAHHSDVLRGPDPVYATILENWLRAIPVR